MHVPRGGHNTAPNRLQPRRPEADGLERLYKSYADGMTRSSSISSRRSWIHSRCGARSPAARQRAHDGGRRAVVSRTPPDPTARSSRRSSRRRGSPACRPTRAADLLRGMGEQLGPWPEAPEVLGRLTRERADRRGDQLLRRARATRSRSRRRPLRHGRDSRSRRRVQAEARAVQARPRQAGRPAVARAVRGRLARRHHRSSAASGCACGGTTACGCLSGSTRRRSRSTIRSSLSSRSQQGSRVCCAVSIRRRIPCAAAGPSPAAGSGTCSRSDSARDSPGARARPPRTARPATLP